MEHRSCADSPRQARAGTGPILEGSLHDLGQVQWAAGLHAEALHSTDEAVRIRKQLAATDPAQFDPALTQSLHELGWMLAQQDADLVGVIPID